MLDRFRPFAWPVAFMLLAGALLLTRSSDVLASIHTFHAAATRVVEGASPYDTGDGRPFTHLPVFALALTPLALFRVESAAALWFIVNAGLLTAFVRWSIHGLPERRRSDETLQWLVLLVMGPVMAHELLAGDVTVLAGVLVMGALLAVQVDLTRVGGVLVGMAILVTPSALLLVPWLALAHGMAAVVATGTVLGLALLAPALVFGWTGNVLLLAEWFQTVGGPVSGPVALTRDVAAGAMWVRWLGPTQLADFVGILLVTALLGLAASLWARRRSVYEPSYLDVAVVLALIPLLSTDGRVWLFLLTTPVVVCLFDRWSEVSRGWQVTGGLAVAGLALGSATLFTPALAEVLVQSSAVPIAGLAVAVSAANLRWKSLA